MKRTSRELPESAERGENMTTMELIERGIGHNCLSDAYNLAISDMREILEHMKESAIANMMWREVDACDRFLEQLKKLEGKK